MTLLALLLQFAFLLASSPTFGDGSLTIIQIWSTPSGAMFSSFNEVSNSWSQPSPFNSSDLPVFAQSNSYAESSTLSQNPPAIYSQNNPVQPDLPSSIYDHPQSSLLEYGPPHKQTTVPATDPAVTPSKEGDCKKSPSDKTTTSSVKKSSSSTTQRSRNAAVGLTDSSVYCAILSMLLSALIN